MCVFAWLLPLQVYGTEPAAAVPQDASTKAARRLAAAGADALAAGRIPEAIKKLEQSFAASPFPDVLYQLGRVAQTQGRRIAAADLYRRYLTTAQDTVDQKIRDRLQAFLADMHEPVVELDIASGDLGALLSIDGRLAGVLPLPGPVLVAPGPHTFKLEKSGRSYQTNPITIRAGQQMKLHLALRSNLADLTLVPVAVLLIESAGADGIPDALAAALFPAFGEAAKHAHASLLNQEQTTAALNRLNRQRPAECIANTACREELARSLDASFLILLRGRRASSRDLQLTLKLLDVQSGMLASTLEETCAACEPHALQALATRVAQKLLSEAENLRRGTLQVTSMPPDANVLVDGWLVGRTPLSRDALDGTHDIVVEKAGFDSAKARTDITAGQASEVHVALTQVVPKPRTLARRPPWRFVVGGIAIGAGGLLTGFGGAALGVNGQCKDGTTNQSTCDPYYDTAAVGAGLTGSGALLIAAGIITMAVPVKKTISTALP